MPPLMLAATWLCVVATAALLVAERRGHRPGRAIAQATASLAFLAVAALAARASAAAAVAAPLVAWFVVGQALGVVGDLALLGHGRRPFLIGLGAFLAGHLAYVVGLAAVVAPTTWPTATGPLAIAPLASGAAALAWLWPHLRGDRASMRGPVIAYVAVITTMVIAALAAWRGAALPATTRALIGAGAALFFVSDLAVARDRFVAAGFINRLWGLPAYYGGQLLLAWALLPR
jgi:uncharacterized membrane protein YhhN